MFKELTDEEVHQGLVEVIAQAMIEIAEERLVTQEKGD